MFRRLVLLVTLLVLAFAGTIVVAMIVGGRLQPDWITYFDKVDICQGRFCLAGMIPGVTSWNAVEKILRGQSIDRLQLDEISEQATGVLGRTGFVVNGLSEGYAPEPIIGEIRLGVDVGSPISGLRVGALVARFGPPCFVRYSTDPNTSMVTLYFPFGTANVLVGSARYGFDASSPIFMLVSDMFMGSKDCRRVELAALPDVTFPWQGFGSVLKYAAWNRAQ
jgi:hypothetical protein